MLFISTLHIGTDVYIVEFKFSSEQKMLVESLGPALTQEGRILLSQGERQSTQFLITAFRNATVREHERFLFQFPFSCFLLHFFDHCCLVLCCAVRCVLTDQPQPGAPLPGLHSAAGSSRPPRANREPISGNLEQRLWALLSHELGSFWQQMKLWRFCGSYRLCKMHWSKSLCNHQYWSLAFPSAPWDLPPVWTCSPRWAGTKHLWGEEGLQVGVSPLLDVWRGTKGF